MRVSTAEISGSDRALASGPYSRGGAGLAFERRRLAASANGAAPIARVAALLLAISRNNSYEGRDPASIPDGLACSFVADLLGFSVASLAAHLVELERRGFVCATPRGGLSLRDFAGLEALAEGSSEVMAGAA